MSRHNPQTAHSDETATVSALAPPTRPDPTRPDPTRPDPEHSRTNMLIGVADSNSAAQDSAPQGRCVCGEKVRIADAHEITLPNGRAGWQGYCPECGAPLFAIRRASQASN
jgi:hypothetical protein